MLDWLINIDKQIFLFINQTLSNPVFDSVLPFFRNATNWIPLYAFVLYLSIKNYRKQVWFWVVFAVLTIVITDQLSAHIIKPLVQRNRPYVDLTFSSQVRLLLSNVNRGYSFVSSHATNHFGIAIFFTETIAVLKKYRNWFLSWAFIICLAQVYVGVHYPLDVACGALLGVFLGKVTAHLFNKYYYKFWQ